MGPKRFSWKRLPEKLKKVLADLVEVRASANDAVWAAALGDAPDPTFIRQHWITLREGWLRADLPSARKVSKALQEEGLGQRDLYGRSREDVLNYLASCRSSPRLGDAVTAVLWELGGVRTRSRSDTPGKSTDTSSAIPASDASPYAGLRRWAPPETLSPNPFDPYDHQTEAWAALDRALASARAIHREHGLRGLLVLPTGGGKTATAVRWLCSKHLQPGTSRQVLWVAHRAELLEQAALTFGRHVDAAGRDRSSPLAVQCLSSRHGRGAANLQVAGIDVTCASIFTLVAGDNERIVERYFEDHPDTFVVIDEAHHAPARSYRWLLELTDQYPGIDVLGLTATPTRTAERERGWISRLFPDGIIYEADLSTLISRGVLATPHMHEVDTGEAIVLSPAEREHLEQFSDYAPATLQRLADSFSRNRAIVDHYSQQADRYGQTLVFATSVAHAMTLAEQFNAEGINADYVTHVMEAGHAPASDVLADFVAERTKVLTSVSKLTEGVDLPNAQTVFLARPTRSEILLKQMVGRALRGPAAKGTEDAHLVSFADHWEDFADWLDPRSLFPPEDIVDEGESDRPALVSATVPWDLYRDLARQVRQAQALGVFELVPAGWYDLSAFESERDAIPLRRLAVFDHQREGFERLIDDALEHRPSSAPLHEHFDGVPHPLPAQTALDAIVQYVDQLDAAPLFIPFADRDTYLPPLVARRYLDNQHESDIDFAGRVWDTSQASVVFPDRNGYIRAVRRHIEDLILEGDGLDDWVPVDLTEELKQPLAPGTWDLDELLDEVHDEMHLTKAVPQIGWSARKMRHYWGYYSPDSPKITINRVLQTDSISREALKFLIFHELLHHELGTEVGHRGEFRPRERQYPEWAKRSAELDGIGDFYLTT